MKEEMFLDSDVLADYLDPEEGRDPVLLALATLGACFTSVLQATELLAAVSGDTQRAHVVSLLGGLHVLGFHHKYCLSFGDLHRKHGADRSLRTSMTAGVCILSHLPIVTSRPRQYSVYPGLIVLDAHRLRGVRSWGEIQNAAYSTLS